MGYRFFPNEMPDFVEEKEEEIATEDDSLMQLLSMPYSALSERFKRAGLDLKETVLSLSLHLCTHVCVCLAGLSALIFGI